MVVGIQMEQRPEIARIGFPRTLLGKVSQRLLLLIEKWTGLQYLIQPLQRRFLTHPFVTNAEIINFHNLHGNFFSFRILPELAQIAPLVWTLHDTWALTGHCSYNYDCDRWKYGCGKCPHLDEYPEITLDTSAYLWKLKRTTYQRSCPTVIAPSKWLVTMAKESPIFAKCNIHHIPYGLDLHEFAPSNQMHAREELGIPKNAKVVMIIALPNARRKGVEYFMEALRYTKATPRPWLLIVGSHGLFKEFHDRFQMTEIGYFESSKMMNTCYAAADVFVLPSLADNLPVSLLEAMASGTPCVAFDVGGVPDLIRHLETGYLAVYRDALDLAAGIDLILSSEELRIQLGRRAREVTEQEYGMDLQVNRYGALYEEVRAEWMRHRVGKAQ
jgi:glycosyltransferase involved in cell wall biosynthesis